MGRFLFTTFLVTTILILGCNPGNFEFPTWKARFVLPVIDATFDLNDLVFADSPFTEDSTGGLAFIYEGADSVRLEEVFEVGDITQSAHIPGISGEFEDRTLHIPITSDILGFDVGVYDSLGPESKDYEVPIDITDYFLEADFKGGELVIDITNHFPFTLLSGMEVVYEYADGHQVTFITDEEISPGATYTLPVFSLRGQQFSGVFTIRLHKFSYDKIYDAIITDQGLDFDLHFGSVVMTRAQFAGLPDDLPSLSFDVVMDLPNGVELKSLTMDQGNFGLAIRDVITSNVRFLITLLSATKDGIPLRISIEEGSETYDLSGYQLDMMKSDQYNNLSFEVALEGTGNNPVEIHFDQDVEIDISLKNIDYGILTGYLGRGEFLISEDIPIDIFERISEGTLLLEGAAIDQTIETEQGLTLQVSENAQLIATNPRLYPGSETVIGDAVSDWLISPSIVPGERVISTLRVDEQSEQNFDEFISSLPSNIAMDLPIIWGTEEKNHDQFLLDTGKVIGKTEIYLPMNMKADRLQMVDTVDVQFAKSDRSIQAEEGIFQTQITSLFPLEISMQNYFLDANDQVIDSLFESRTVLQAAEIDSLGNVISPVVQEFVVAMEFDRIDEIRQTTRLATHIWFHTQSPDPVILRSDYDIHVKLISDILLNVDLNQ